MTDATSGGGLFVSLFLPHWTVVLGCLLRLHDRKSITPEWMKVALSAIYL